MSLPREPPSRIVSERWVYPRAFPESEVIVPGWARGGGEGDRIWEVGVGSAPVQIAGTRRLKNCREMRRRCITLGAEDTLL